MSLALYHHPACEGHDPGPDHSERALRLTRILESLQTLPGLDWRPMPVGARDDIERVHTADYVDFVFGSVPRDATYREIEINDIQSDDDGGEVTVLSRGSGDALWHATGGVTAAVDAVVSGRVRRAFCATRPPGHHALAHKAMGFCVFNNVAIAARRALAVHGLRHVAIVDFDVHHGNGTQAIFQRDPSVFFASIHQLPLWPETGHAHETGIGNIVNVPVGPHWPRTEWLQSWRCGVLAALERVDTDLLLISAGFDAHRDDPKGSQNLLTEDYATITRDLVDYAERRCGGRIVSVLEGGYDLTASADGAAAHVAALAEGA